MSINIENTKIRVGNPENSKRIQEYAFTHGFRWREDTDRRCNIRHCDARHIYLIVESGVKVMGHGKECSFFKEHENKEIFMLDLFPKPTVKTRKYDYLIIKDCRDTLLGQCLIDKDLEGWEHYDTILLPREIVCYKLFFKRLRINA